MLTFNTQLDVTYTYPIHNPWKMEDILIFDIETTGLSPATSYLYLIGCMYYTDNSWHLTQWLAEDINNEICIIEAFMEKIKTYKRIIHYNGSGFDIPYILKKCKKHNLASSLDTIQSFDLYKKFQPYKKLLPTKDLKLKTLEKLVNLERVDTLSGEELIKVYSGFVGRLQYEKLHKIRLQNQIEINTNDTFTHSTLESITGPSSSDLMNLLLLHNKEDIIGLLKIADLLFFIDGFQLNVSFHKYSRKLITEHNTEYYKIHIYQPFVFPCSLMFRTPLNLPNLNILLEFSENQIVLTLPLYKGELKLFYDNYKDYFYLPKEDIAIHKSVSQFVDKEYKTPAKANNCYQKVTSNFIPQPGTFYTPCFKENINDKLLFFDINNKDFQVAQRFQEFVMNWLEFILHDKLTVLD